MFLLISGISVHVSLNKHSCGYKGTGVEFIEDGRPHRAMRILIQTLEEDPQAELLG